MNSDNLSFFSRMSTRIAALVVAAVFAVAAVQIVAASRLASRSMESAYLNYARNLAEEAAEGVDFASEYGESAYGGYAKNLAQEAALSINFSRRFGESVYKSYALNLAEEAASAVNIASRSGALPPGELDGILRRVSIRDVQGSYAYMVSPSGTMLWHPVPDKIGQPVENAAVRNILADLKRGYKPESGSVLYDYRGALKLAGYAFTQDGDILIVTADYSEFMKIDYDTLLGNIRIDGVEGSYAYMVSPEGTMLWHTDTPKIGRPVENDAVKGLVAAIKSGRRVEDGYIVYQYRGAAKMAGYSFTDTGNIVVVTADYDRMVKVDYGRLIGGIKIDGVAGSYAYMVSPNGTMLYHKDKSKIGGAVENAAVKSIVSRLQEGQKVPDGSCVYDYRGAVKIAGYAFTKAGNIVIVTADREAMMLPVGRMRRSLAVYGALCGIAAVVLVYVFTVWLMKALRRIVPVINRTAELDFSEDSESARLEGCSDEIGLIARAVARTRSRLHEVVEDISGAEASIEASVDGLRRMIERVGHACENNSARTEELAAGMQKTADTTAAIAGNAGKVDEHAGNIGTLADNGVKVSGEVLARANELADAAEKAGKRTRELYESVKSKAGEAVTASQSVNKINDLISSIMSISTQTGMLSLNASIEAARAGDAGRGFAVVAQEIRSLAGQTAEVVNSITPIIAEVNSAVANVSDCLATTTDFLEANVLADYEDFSKVSRQYREDANTFGRSMEEIKKSLAELMGEIEDIAGAISGMNETVRASSEGVSDIAGKTAEMAGDALGGAEQADACGNVVADLNGIIRRFKL
ncbi:MAG: methyl-accepting chemotaxis protein [Synergistaceae bacterium]|nr:methyl-accepting chemotaxis protein [Synergistaceae bacterium]